MNSLRFRITALVTIAFALVATVGSLMFVSWFEDRLVDDVRADDSRELDRQEAAIELFNAAAKNDPALVTRDQVLNPENAQPIVGMALIPDDGTLIRIVNEAGTLITDSEASLDFFSVPAPSDDQAAPSDETSLSPADMALATGGMLALLSEVESGLAPELVEQYEPSIRLLREVFSDPTMLDPPQQSELASARDEDFDAAMAGLAFGRETQPDADSRLITTAREATLIDLPISIVADSRVTSVDAAVDNVRGTLRLAIPILAALVAALTYLATGRALRPVAAITNQVNSISSAETGGRVPVPNSRDEVNHLATTMNKMLGRLESASSTQRRFVSDVSHELRTPSAVIRAEIEAGLADPDNDWTATAQSVLGEQSRLTRLVDDLLLLASLDEGGKLSRTEIDLDQLVQDEANRGWPHPVSVANVEPVRIAGDAAGLTRAIENLVANANRHATSRVMISLRQVDGHAVLWVDDDGAGIDVDDRERIFERFARLDESRQRDAGGSGLGLAIVKEIAEAHGGQASVTDSPMGGARFELCLA